MKDFFLNFLQRHQVIHTSVNAGHNCNFFLFQKRFHHTHSLADQQISLNISLEEQQILRRIKKCLFVIKTQVFTDFLCLALIPCDHKTPGRFLGKPMYEMCFLGFQTAGNLYDSLLFFHTFLDFLKFRHFFQRLGK